MEWIELGPGTSPQNFSDDLFGSPCVGRIALALSDLCALPRSIPILITSAQSGTLHKSSISHRSRRLSTSPEQAQGDCRRTEPSRTGASEPSPRMLSAFLMR